MSASSAGSPYGNRGSQALKELLAAAKAAGSAPPGGPPPGVGADEHGNGGAPERAAEVREPHRPRRLAHWRAKRATSKALRNGPNSEEFLAAKANGELRGHIAAVDYTDQVLVLGRYDAQAREGVAISSLKLLRVMTDAAGRLVVSLVTESRAREREAEVNRQIAELQPRVAEVHEAAVAADAACPEAPKPLPPSEEEIEAAERSKRPVSRPLRLLLLIAVVLGAFIEAFFSGSFASDAGFFGLPLLPPEVNLVLPWLAGAAIGGLIVVGAEIAGKVNIGVITPKVLGRAKGLTLSPRNPASGPWWHVHAADLWICSVATFVLLRAIYSAFAYDLAAGVLGVAVGAIMLGVAMISAAGAASLELQEAGGQAAAARARYLKEQRLAATRPLTEWERLRDVLRAYYDELFGELKARIAERDAYRSIIGLAQDERVQAEVELGAGEKQSEIQAAEADALATRLISVDIGFALSVFSTYHDDLPERPWSQRRGLRRSDAGTGELPVLKAADVLRRFGFAPKGGAAPNGEANNN